jgi:hypothetical protein
MNAQKPSKKYGQDVSTFLDGNFPPGHRQIQANATVLVFQLAYGY